MKPNYYKQPANKIENDVSWGGMSFEEFIKNINSGDISRTAMMEDSVVMSCANVIATNIAAMSCHLYEQNNVDFIRVENNITKILSRPNKIQSYFEFTKEMILNMLINRDSYAVMNFHNGKLVSIEPIQNATLAERTVGSDIWHVTGTVRNEYIDVPYENVIHFRDTIDRFNALSSILQSKVAANKLITKAFEGGLNSNIKAWIQLAGTANSETKKKIKSEFNKVLRSENDDVAVLDDGMILNPITGGTHSFQESQLVQLINELDNKIHQVMNVPLVMTSIAEGSYNISVNLRSMFIQSLLPFVKMIEQEYFYKLLTRNEKNKYYFKMNYKSLMRGNDSERMDYYSKALEKGIMTQGEVRRLEDLPHIDGTDDILMSLNYVPLSKYDDYLDKRYNAGENEENDPNEINITEE